MSMRSRCMSVPADGRQCKDYSTSNPSLAVVGECGVSGRPAKADWLDRASLLGWQARISDAVKEKRLDKFQRIDRLQAYRYVPIPFRDDVRIVASSENEGHAAPSQSIGQRKHHLALHVDIEYRAVQTAATFEQFHGTLEALGWSYILDGQARKHQRDVVGRQELVLDHQDAPTNEGAP